MTIKAEIIADSISKGCPRLTTFQLRYPRFIHSEVMTHRAFSRNASSSRAIPIEKMIQDVLDDPAKPVHWGKNKPGMQATEEVDHLARRVVDSLWIEARNEAVRYARMLNDRGVHKQVVNRVLEPYMHINVLLTGTQDAFEHFLDLRDHQDAQPEIRELAIQIATELFLNQPQELGRDEWHMPYLTATGEQSKTMRQVSTAMCASVSYKTVDGKPMTTERALSIWDKLVSSKPIHASPLEHIAKPFPRGNKQLCRNFTCWAQYRAVVEMKNGTEI